MSKLNAQQPIRLKCIVLGSSGAGKTKFLRRYFYGTFDDHRKSTIGADFYTNIIPNPLYASDDSDVTHNETSRGSKSQQTKKNDEPQDRTVNRDKKKKSSSKKDGKKSKKDGKKSKKASKRKKEKDKAKAKSERAEEHNAKATSGSFASPPPPPQSQSQPFTKRPFVALQMWDTAGKEKLVSKNAGLTSRLGDAFFRHANVAILIYDATSSRSFLQLIKWHSELLERICRVHFGDASDDGDGGSDAKQLSRLHYERMVYRIQFGRHFPVLVVATKIDLLEAAEASKSRLKRIVPQRDVMGLGRTFKGMELYYEYAVFDFGQHHQSYHHDDGNGHGHHQLRLRKGMQRKDSESHSSLMEEEGENERGKKKMSLSYGLEDGSWAPDKDYMHFVKIAEDACFPDRTMVQRWCKHNGLHHVEVSALENKGLDEAVETAVTLAIKEMERLRQGRDETGSDIGGPCVDDTGQWVYDHWSDEGNANLDFQERYQTEECDCCGFLLPRKLRR